MDQATEAAPARKLSLLEILEHYQAVLDEIDAAEGEVTEETGAKLDALNISLEEKGEGYAAIIRMLEEQAAASRAFVKRYTERAQRKEKQAAALQARMLEALKATGRKKLETMTVTLSVAKSPASLRITGKVPPEYCKPAEPDTSFIKTELKAGKALGFAELDDSNVHLRIR